MKSSIKRLTIIFIAAFVCMMEVANAFYDPGLQRWINRDPIQERGGTNLFNSFDGSPINKVDPFGYCDTGVLVEGELAAGEVGLDISIGIVIDTDSPLESGIFVSGGGSKGR